MRAKESIEELLERLERQLLAPEARQSRLVSELLVEEFIEFGSSGGRFNKAQATAALQAEAPSEVTASEFRVQLLSPQVALITYRTQHPGEPLVYTLRSSIWLQREERWQMIFHQGTLASAQTQGPAETLQPG